MEGMEAGSWQNATELLVDVADHGEDTGLIVAAKDDDLDSFSTRVFTLFDNILCCFTFFLLNPFLFLSWVENTATLLGIFAIVVGDAVAIVVLAAYRSMQQGKTPLTEGINQQIFTIHWPNPLWIHTADPVELSFAFR
ncbi:hypothetical protein Pint_19884 [Pistacia integerrima]|uniref:Uncharacterized protein n=1 Tax=Pistacia integerrima TaxID=434235 RepID=A0ACC0XCM8_9ROSI|nr:hypothetical protein Pint_19884 [Pistacia integerrima]